MGLLDAEFFGIQPVVGDEGGITRVEPLSPYGVVQNPEAAWRLPWRP
jgi:hypothetical protein